MKNLFLAIFILSGSQLAAQDAVSDSLQSLVEKQVSGFLKNYWDAYNACEVEKLLNMESDSIEFYHDLGGLDAGKEKSKESWEQFCNNTHWRTKAEWDGAYEVSPMLNRHQLYGAVVIGKLKFQATRLSDNHTQPLGKSRYMAFLNYDGDSWKMHRVFSFDHQPVD